MRTRLGGEPLRGHLDLLVLSVLRDTEAHGYRVIELLRESSGGTFDLPEGTIYPALHRLEKAGYLRSRWTSGAGPRRRVYVLTPAGRRERRRQGESWRAFTRAVDGVLGAG